MSESSEISALRREYVAAGLQREQMQQDPMQQFEQWMQAALKAHPDDATSMTLATADAEGWPAARIVLLKRYDERGFCWFTDFRSEKGQHLEQNPKAELMFYWRGLERQVRIRGRVEKLPYTDGENYFHQRPRGSQLSAAVSDQTQPIDHRVTLEQRVEALDAQFKDAVVPCPKTWGGYCLVPEHFEFWQGRENRLHDRFRYTLAADQWRLERLQP